VFPLGGYVKMLDEREGEVAAAELPRAFNRQSVGRRAVIVAAGPAANFLLAIVLVLVPLHARRHGAQAAPRLCRWRGRRRRRRDPEGGTVRAVNGKAIATWQELRWEVMRRP
jgi:regulator of sigma E protease